jgi:predicted nucleic acid-binding protein
VNVVYDAGVLIGAERNDRGVWAEHRARLELGIVPVTTAPVVAQVSRSARQAQLRRFLRGCDVVPFVAAQAHVVGELLAATTTADVVDAHVVVVAGARGAAVLSCDRGDIAPLAARLSPPVRVLAV